MAQSSQRVRKELTTKTAGADRVSGRFIVAYRMQPKLAVLAFLNITLYQGLACTALWR